jgi:hypothetical protein
MARKEFSPTRGDIWVHRYRQYGHLYFFLFLVHIEKVLAVINQCRGYDPGKHVVGDTKITDRIFS